MKYLLFAITCLHACVCCSQQRTNYNWWNPADADVAVVEGRFWHKELAAFYDRLPARAEKLVRPELWRLSKHTAGEYLKFSTSSPEIAVRYTVTGNRSMDHMPATGVSGVDLYALDDSGNWHWARGAYSFADTIVYRFTNIASAHKIKEFRLYLPLYNSINWLQIGVPEKHTFHHLRASVSKPIVVYGTSIMQGACASRPGLAWTNILGRKLNMPVINLGFSGNGRLEQPLIDLINEADASLFVLDCQPNLVDKNVYSETEIEQRIVNSVKSLQSQHPATPILLTGHCCGLPAVNMDTALTSKYNWTSTVLTKTVTQLKKQGVKNIYLLTAEEIGFDAASTVDGTHPTDIGMMKYADAYEKKILEIINKKAL